MKGRFFSGWAVVCLLLVWGVSSPLFADSLLDTLLPKRTETDTAKKTGLLHGNIESKIYHASDCEHYMCKNCTQTFSSAKEAKEAGYVPCQLCGGEYGLRAKNLFKPKAKEAEVVLRGNPYTKILHGVSCPYYRAKSVTETFTSIQEAQKQGYRLCTVCNGR
ncbi:MAG: hypothetical protein IJS54_02360 [Desulfovibrio sp.]|nr:hypothetical protein [Desulfovibrio sp.]